jgi:hypothetical protein
VRSNPSLPAERADQELALVALAEREIIVLLDRAEDLRRRSPRSSVLRQIGVLS